MRCVARAAVVGAPLSFLSAATLLLSGCPMTDDYRIGNDAVGGAGSNADTQAGGAFDVSPTGGRGAAGTGDTPWHGIDAQVAAGGALGTSGCISRSNQGHEYAFCFGSLVQADARTNCGERGMTLVVIEDQAENAWIAKTLSEQYRGSGTRAFIGANDLSTEGEWRWADGVTFWRKNAVVSGRYANWQAGQPNDSSPANGASEDCLSIGVADGTWDDVSCTAELPYVCEPR
jgi:hypothetical protein